MDAGMLSQIRMLLQVVRPQICYCCCCYCLQQEPARILLAAVLLLLLLLRCCRSGLELDDTLKSPTWTNYRTN
jgi:hypothetical protein